MSPTTTDAVVFDPDAIEKLRLVAGDQDPGFVAEMANLFAEETAKSVNDLQAGSARDDWKAVCRVAHSLKSSAATLGFMRLSNVCKSLEMNTRGASADADTKGLVASVLAEFEITAPLLKNIS